MDSAFISFSLSTLALNHSRFVLDTRFVRCVLKGHISNGRDRRFSHVFSRASHIPAHSSARKLAAVARVKSLNFYYRTS
jgi:hypothetical protein